MDAFNPKSKRIAVDTETQGSNPWQDGMPFNIGMCDDDGQTWNCEWKVDPYTRNVSPNMEDWKFIQSILGNPDIVKIFHNASFDYKMLVKMDFDIKGRIEDTMFMARIYDNTSFDNGLKPLAKKYCRIPTEDVDVLHQQTIAARKVAKAMGWNIADEVYLDYWLPKALDPTNKVCEEYCRTDCYRTMGIWLVFNRMFEREKNQYWRNTYERELELFQVVMKMEGRGVGISRPKCQHERAVSVKRLEEAYAEMVKIVGHDFSPNSPKQLQEILFDRFELPILEWTAGGEDGSKRAPSTRLVAIRPHAAHPFVNWLLDYRSAHKSIGTFFDNYLECMVPDPNHRGFWEMHPNINQLLTRTHRFSMHDPNLQQVANADTSTLGGRMVAARHPFGPRPRHVWFSADYAQQELRVFAALAGIQDLIQAIREGKDPNTENANFAWGGRGNKAALMAAKLALELKDPKASKPEISAIWDDFGWEPDVEMARGGMNSRRADNIARAWLDRFDWKIVQAEATLGKKNTRSRCKIVTFDIMYGGGAQSLMGLLYCTLEEANEFLKIMHGRYPEIRQFSRKLTNMMNAMGYIVNPYGRRLKTEDGRDYTCVNYMIQSSAADMMKDTMVRCQKYIDESRLRAYMVLTVHDELVFEVHEEDCYRWFLNGLRDRMEDCGNRFSVPMKAEFNACPVQWNLKIPVDPEGDPMSLISREIQGIKGGND